jgi:hypothetical protein
MGSYIRTLASMNVDWTRPLRRIWRETSHCSSLPRPNLAQTNTAVVLQDDKAKPSIVKPTRRGARPTFRPVVGRYKGRIAGWDVVNEALNEDELCDKHRGQDHREDYIAKAFEFAREADQRQAVLQRHSLENEAKRNGAVELIRKLRIKGFQSPQSACGT